MTPPRRTAVVAGSGGLRSGVGACLGLVTGAVPLDLGICGGHGTQVHIAAPREVVFE